MGDTRGKPPEVLVTGGTGTVGTALVHELVERGLEPRALTRSPDAVDSPVEGVRYVGGELGSRPSLEAAMEGVERLFLLTPLARNEAELGRKAAAAAEEAGVERIVFLSVHRAEAGAHIPHFRSKLEIAGAIEEAGVPATVLRPNAFFQNDLLLREAIEAGVYPQPVGSRGVSRVDVADIAAVAATALLEEGLDGEVVPVAGPEALTGESVAETWSRHLGREVRYAGDDLEAWASMASDALPGWLVRDLKTMYAYFQRHGLVATEGELRRQRELLGRDPRSYDDFVADTVAAWRSAPAG